MLIFSGVFVLCLKRSNPGSFLQTRSGKSINIPTKYAKNVKFQWNFAKIKGFRYELIIGRTRFGWGVGRENHRVCSWKSGFTSCRARKTFYWMRTMHRNALGTVWGPYGREGREKTWKINEIWPKSMDFAMFGHWEIWFWMRGRPGKSSSYHWITNWKSSSTSRSTRKTSENMSMTFINIIGTIQSPCGHEGSLRVAAA